MRPFARPRLYSSTASAASAPGTEASTREPVQKCEESRKTKNPHANTNAAQSPAILSEKTKDAALLPLGSLADTAPAR
jgi:hypothetical protein